MKKTSIWDDKSTEEKDKILRESYKRMLGVRLINCFIAALIVSFMFAVYQKEPTVSSVYTIYACFAIYLGAGIWFFYQLPCMILLVAKCYVMSTEALFVFSKKKIKSDKYCIEGGSVDIHYLTGPYFRKYYLEEVPHA